VFLFIRELSLIHTDEIMATLKIEPGSDGRVWVSLTRFSSEDLARLKAIPGHRWNPERKQWSFPDTPEARQALAEIVALPPAPPPKMLAVKPKTDAQPPCKPPKRYVPGRDKPLTTNPPHPLIKKVDDELVLRGMAYTTRKSYGQHLRNYFEWLKNAHIEPERATREDIRAYLVKLASSGRVSGSYCRGARMALIYLYETILKQPDKVGDLPQIQRPEQLPVVLSREEVVRLFKVTTNLKHKTLLVVAYSAGLRVGEAVRLKMADLDPDRKQIRIKAGKGAKDRYTVLSDLAWKFICAYHRTYAPGDWLFPGEEAGDHLSTRAAQHVFKDSKKKAGIIKEATFHSLRHSFATHLLEDKVDVRYIQELLGHDSIETTQRYTHVTNKALEQIRSPLDNLPVGGSQKSSG